MINRKNILFSLPTAATTLALATIIAGCDSSGGGAPNVNNEGSINLNEAKAKAKDKKGLLNQSEASERSDAAKKKDASGSGS